MEEPDESRIIQDTHKIRATFSQVPKTITGSVETALGRKLSVLAFGLSGYIYKCGEDLVYKMNATQHEFELMKAASDCAVAPLSRVLDTSNSGRVFTSGIITELGTPFDIMSVPRDRRTGVKDEMVALLTRLHRVHGMIHGDVKPVNMIRCRDGSLRFCDFDSARRIEDDASKWEGFGTPRYYAPSRGYPFQHEAPIEADDWYAMAISVWELYTGKRAFHDGIPEEDEDAVPDMEAVLAQKGTVDVTAVDDENVREWMTGILRQGGANI